MKKGEWEKEKNRWVRSEKNRDKPRLIRLKRKLQNSNIDWGETIKIIQNSTPLSTEPMQC